MNKLVFFFACVMNALGINVEERLFAAVILALVPSFLNDLATLFERDPSASITKTLDLSYIYEIDSGITSYLLTIIKHLRVLSKYLFLQSLAFGLCNIVLFNSRVDY